MIKTIFISIIYLAFSFSRDCLIEDVHDLENQYREKSRPIMDAFMISSDGYFYIHYDTLGGASPNLDDLNNNLVPDYVEEVGIIADSARYVLLEIMGYNAEIPDEDGIYDIYLWDYGPNEYGVNISEGNGVSYIKIDNDFVGYDSPVPPLQIMRATLSHEYFHAIQRGYKPNYALNDKYFLEMTSMWIEDVIVPDGNDYLNGWQNPLFNYPEKAFDDTGPGYELALFGHYLSCFIDEKGKNNPKESTIIKEIWENYSSNSQYPLAFNSLNEVLNMNYTPFNECWVDFLARNLFNGHYEDMNNPIYYYTDQKLISPISTSSSELVNTIKNINIDNKSAQIFSFDISDLETILQINNSSNLFSAEFALISEVSDRNDLFWIEDSLTTNNLFPNEQVHLLYSTALSSLSFDVELNIYTVPLSPENFIAIPYQDSVVLQWDPSPGPGSDLIYEIYRDNVFLSETIETTFKDSFELNEMMEYSYFIICKNSIGSSEATERVSIYTWPDEENVLDNKIIKLYPNPYISNMKFQVIYALKEDYSQCKIKVIDLGGRTIYSQELFYQYQGWHRYDIDLLMKNKLSSGIYFICFVLPNQEIFSRKFIVL